MSYQAVREIFWGVCFGADCVQSNQGVSPAVAIASLQGLTVGEPNEPNAVRSIWPKFELTEKVLLNTRNKHPCMEVLRDTPVTREIDGKY